MLHYIFKCLSHTVCFPQKLTLGKLLYDLNSCFRDTENLLSEIEGTDVFFKVSETCIISNPTCKSMSCKNAKIMIFQICQGKKPKNSKVEVNDGLFAVISRTTNFDLLSFGMCFFLRNAGNTENYKATVRCYFSFHHFDACGKQSPSELQCFQSVCWRLHYFCFLLLFPFGYDRTTL